MQLPADCRSPGGLEGLTVVVTFDGKHRPQARVHEPAGSARDDGTEMSQQISGG